jgi:formate hydrogenlyase subunit 3/multisubunit Na+/H+ antiporter MnhD subunit
MWKNIPESNKKKFSIIVFFVLPILCIIGFIIGTKIAFLVFNVNIDRSGIVFVLIIILIGYIRCVYMLYNKLKIEREPNNHSL